MGGTTVRRAITRMAVTGVLFCAGLLPAAEGRPAGPGDAIDALLPALSLGAFARDAGATSDAEAVARARGELDRLWAAAGASDAARKALSQAVASRLGRDDVAVAAKVHLVEAAASAATRDLVPALSALLSPEVVPPLAEAALEALVLHPHADAKRELRKALRTATGALRIGVIDALGERRDFLAAADLMEAADDPDLDVRLAALRALARIGDVAAVPVLEAALASLEDPARTEALRIHALLAASLVRNGERGPARRIYIALMGEGPEFRAAALRGFAEAGLRMETGRVLAGLDDPDEGVREAAREAAAILPGDEVAKGLLDRLSASTGPEERARTIGILERREEPMVRERLERLREAASGKDGTEGGTAKEGREATEGGEAEEGVAGDASPPRAPEPGRHGHFLVLTGKTHAPPPFASVDIVYGPREEVDGATWLWWELSARAESSVDSQPLFRLRALTSRDPLAPRTAPTGPAASGPAVSAAAAPIAFRRYVLGIEATGERLEYRDVHTPRALLPPWRAFEDLFVPGRARGSGEEDGVAQTAEYLGHVLTLQWVGRGVPWAEWDGVKALDLDPELLVGTSRNFRDAEGRRLPQVPERRNYTYVPFAREEYPVMMEAGINCYIVDDRQFEWVRGEPVFHWRRGGKNIAFPADLYRSNYLGSVMFLDEPGIIMVGDENIHKTLRYFADAAAVLQKRIRASYRGTGSYGAFNLEGALVSAGVNLGDLRIEGHDYPAWETLFETAHYQLEAGLAGIVHEGRYRLDVFDAAVARFVGGPPGGAQAADAPRKHTARELLRYHFGILRGAARAFGGSWGTSIYGQCDPAIAPEAMALAYDMGARYVWFWTSDHDHHMPWPEQLRLARGLKDHAAKHPRPSIRGQLPVLDAAIVLPYGYFPSLEDLWWVRVLDREGKDEASRRYRRLMRGVIAEFHRAVDAGEDFDITIDGGTPRDGDRNEDRNGYRNDDRNGYRKTIRVTDAEEEEGDR